MKDKNDILVSICAIAYNHAPYIRQCLDGFLMQKTNFKYEIIIHDDCSTDGTTEVVREYAKNFPDIIVPIIQAENQYQKGNRHILSTFIFPKLKGKYWAICECDDYWTDPLKLQKQVDFLEVHPDYSMCFHRAMILKEYDCKVGLRCDDIENREYDPNELFKEWKVPTASIVAKRETLEIQNTGSERILNGDIVHVLNCAKVGKIRGMSDVMSVYRVQSSGVTYDPQAKYGRYMKYPDHFLFFKDNYPFLRKYYVNKKIARAYLNRRKFQRTIKAYMNDFFLAFYYNPLFIIEKIQYLTEKDR